MNSSRNFKIKPFQCFIFSIFKITIDNRSHNGACGWDGETLAAFTMRTTCPASVDQINLCIRVTQTLHQEFCINTWGAWEKRCAEAGGKGGLDAAALTNFCRT